MKMKIILIITSLLIITSFISCHFTPSDEIFKTKFDNNESLVSSCDFIFSDYKKNSYLDSLRTEFKIDSLVGHADSELQKAFILLNWVHTRWEHSGSNTPAKSDAISILNEAKTGKNFRCTEYSIVLSAVLNSIGIPARVVGIKVKDVGSTLAGAGHVVTEAYLSEFNKWIFLDAQMNYIPFLNNKPLNAVEYKDAIVNNIDNLELKSLKDIFDKEAVKMYANWTGKYLYYFDTKFDNREGQIQNRITCEGKAKLMLVPMGAENPTKFQVFSSMDNLLYTHNLKDFYKKPKIDYNY
jgi:hypothetical protein